MAAADYAVVVQQLYVAYFGRPADTKGLTDFQNLLNATGVKADIASVEAAYRTSATVRAAVDQFGTSPESATLYGNGDNLAFVKAIYANVLNRTPADADTGLQFWVTALTAGSVTKGNIALSIMAAAKVNTSEQGKIDALTVDKKILVAGNFTTAIATLNATFSGDAATLAARDLLAKVTSTTDATTFQTQVEDCLLSLTPGQTFTLTTGADEKVGTDNGDYIDATVSSLTSERTLNADDKIDGGKGYDVLRADLKSNFTGFTADKGYMKNVEKAELTNSTGIARAFDATGTTGLKDFVLNAKGGAISLANVQDATGHITLNEQAEGTLSVGYTTKAVEGTADTLGLNLNKVGTAAVKNEAGVTTTAAKYVSVTTSGLEKVAIDSQSGANYVNLAGATGSTSVTVAGAGTTDIQAVASTVTSFDASAAKGAVTANLAAGGTLTSVKGGAGNDTITVDLTKVAANATIAGGAGTNTLAVAAANLAGTTLQPTMTGFQTLEFAGATTGDLTLSAKNISDLDTLSLKTTNSVGGNVNVIGLQAATLNIKTTGTQGGTINSTSASAINYTTAATAAATTAQTPDTASTLAINAGEAASATINVGAYTVVGGSVSVAKAADVTLNVASGKNKATPAAEVTAFTGTIEAAKAQSIVVDAKGNLTGATINAAEAGLVKVTTASDVNSLTLNTAKATNVEIVAAKGLDLSATGNTDLTGAESVTVKANGGFVNLTGEALSKVNNLVVAGAAKDSQFKVGALGTTAQDYSLSVTASGLKAGLEIGAVNSKADISVDVAGTTGNNVITSINAANGTDGAGGNVTLNAAGSAGSTKVGDITAGATKTVTINGNGILGKNASNNALELGAVAASKGTISLNVKDTLSAVQATSLNAKTVTIEADGLAKDLTIGVAGTAADVTADDLVVKAGTALGNVRLNDISALKSVNYTGSETTQNIISITAGNSTPAAKDTLAVTIKGGILADNVTLTSSADTTAGNDIVNANIDLGVNPSTAGNEDTVTLKAAAAGGFTSEALVLKNVEKLIIDSTTTNLVTINASALSGQEITVAGVVANGVEVLNLKGTDIADTIDLSKLKIDATNAAALRFVGGKGADTVTLSAGTDTVAFTAATEYGDTVKAFAAGTDKIEFAKALATSADAVFDTKTATIANSAITKAAVAVHTDEGALVSAAVNAGAANKVAAADLKDLTKVAALLGDTVAVTDATATGAANSLLFIVEASDATTTAESFAVYSWTQATNADTTIGATELTLVGVFTGTGAVATTDIVLV